MNTLEILLRGVGVAQLLLLGWLMLRARRRVAAARLGALLCASVAAFLVVSSPAAQISLGPLVYPLTALCAVLPVLFWLFCSALFTDEWQPSHSHAVLLGAMAVAGTICESAALAGGTGPDTVLQQFASAAFAACSVGFAILAPVGVFLRRADLDPRRRRIRNWFVPIIGLYLAGAVTIRLVTSWSGAVTPASLILLNLLIIVVAASTGLLGFVEVRVVNWLDVTGPTERVRALNRVERRALEQLERRLVAERLYAREGMSIAMLAELLHTQEHVMRRVINRALGHRNFNDFLHSHRLREAARRLRDPAQLRTPVLTIALESGYASIGPFNRAFKERFGVTPSAFRRRPADLPGREFAPGQPVPGSLL